MNSPVKLPDMSWSLIEALPEDAVTGVFIYAAQAVREALAAQSEWMPIETAPEGTMILCANMNAEEAREWAYVAWMSQGKVCCMFRCGMPTHWMPLPSPPKENNHEQK